MNDKDIGVITALMERLVKYRLPRVLAIRERVDGGAVLEEQELDFLERILEDAQEAAPFFEHHPEYSEVIGKVLSLYRHITSKALENERGQGTAPG